MAVNDIIKIADYNDIRNIVTSILGPGSGNSGYGQNLLSSAVAEGNKVTINEWSNLRWDLINAYVHQNGSLPTTVVVSEGETVRFSSVDAPVTTYLTLANNIATNKFNVGAGQSASVTPTSPTTRTTTWNSSVAATLQFYWATPAYARWFFNSGGLVRITSSFNRTTGVNTAQNQAWENLLSTAGTRSFGGNTPGTGTSPADGTNWYKCTNTFQEFYKVSSSSPYGSNYYRLLARVADVASNSSGTSASGEIRIEFVDGYTDPGNYYLDVPNTSDVVDGVLTINVSLQYATGVLYPIGIGNFIVQQPTVALSAITGS